MSEHLTALLHLDSSLDVSQTQLLLDQLVQPNEKTQFGQRFGFADIKSPQDYRKAVPLGNYEHFRPWVDKVIRAEPSILTASRTVALFKTSGSMAKPKYIPVTSDLMRQKISIFAAFWEQVYTDYPSIRHGKMVTNFADAGEVEILDSKMQVFSESSFWARRGRGLHSMHRWPLPAQVRQIKDPDLRSYVCARLLLQEDMSCIMCLNPSTLLHFCRIIEKYAGSLADGLQHGTWGRDDLRSVMLTMGDLATVAFSELSESLGINTMAADRLQQFVQTNQPPALAVLWPSLKLIICWRSRVVQPYFKQLACYTQGVAMRDYITQSSECMMAVPRQDSVSGGVLAHTAHFFEFIPEQHVDDDQPQTCFAWQLQAGHRYELVVSTGGGLYRYRTGDCVLVTGFSGQLPEIEFLYRLGKTSSMTGEKLTEHHILIAAQKATEFCKYGPEEFLCFPCSGEQPHYALALDFADACGDSSQIARWAIEFDAHLQRANSEYADKCNSGRLGKIKAFRAAAGHLRQTRLNRRAAGVSEEQVKSEVLSTELDLHQNSLQLVAIA